MIGWTILAVYLIGLVLTARKAAVALMDGEFDAGTIEDSIAARALGLIVGLLWPLVVAGALATGRLPKSNGQLRDEVRQRDARIRELERELGIGKL